MSETTSPASKPAGGQFGGVWFFPWMIVLLLLGSLGIPSDWNPFSKHIEGMELWSYDLRIRLQGGVPFSSDKIVVVAIDDNSFETLGSKPATRQDSKWPFPNSFHAQVAKRLTDWGARAVAFDLLSFANPSRPRYQGEDEAFADVSSQTGRMIIAAKFGTKSKESWDLGFLGTEIMSEVWTTPASVFRQVPRGYINFPLEVNDTVRRYLPYYWRMAVKPINPFAIETLRIASCPGIDLTLAPTAVGTPPALVYFPFVHPQEIARSIIPYWQVLLASNTTASDAISWKDLEERVKDRIVLVGPTFIESQDFFAHPFALSGNLTRIPGVFLHAMVANSAFLPKTVYRLPRAWEQIIASAFLVTGLVLSWVLSPAIGFMAFLLLSGLYVAAGVGLFSRNLIWIPLAAPLFSSAIALIPNLAVRLLDSERKRVMVKDLFSKYVSADVLEHVQAHPELLKLEGERREVTVFFSDLKGFTTISETMTPEKLSQIMNDYLTPMTEIIMYHQGYLDKYIGDAIMAVFGAPMSDPEHALHACLAAVKQRNRLRKLAKELEEACGVKVSARMGVNSGMVCAGNMGSKDRFQYTVMGDVVNQASRFEGANKIFGSVIMIGEGTFVAAQDRIIARKLAHLTVKGKTQAVVVYELLEVKAICSEAEAASLSALCQSFNQAMEAFFKGDINEAAAQFDAILATHPDDGPSRFYLDDCRGLLAQGKPASFTGGIKLDSK